MKAKKFAAALAIALICVTVGSLSIVPLAESQVRRVKTYAFIGAVPNPVGVGQETLLLVGITTATTDRNGWYNITVTVTRPDGVTETLGPKNTDTTGTTGILYIPTLVGNYTFQMHFPEQVVTLATQGIPAGTIMLESYSEKLTVVVTEEPAPIYPAIPIPTEYWVRPIDAQAHDWGPISGNWVADPPNLFAPYNDGPETAHILWTKSLEMGGIVGGEYDGHVMCHGDAYEGRFLGRTIINGILYYNLINPQDRGTASVTGQEVVAVDLHTGETLWSRPLLDLNNISRSLEFGQITHWDSFNIYGCYAYLWTVVGNTWNAYDAFTGKWAYTMNYVPSGTRIYGANGEILIYTVNLANGWITQWNSTYAVNQQNTNSTIDGSWGRHFDPTRAGRIINATKGIQWNITIPKGLPGTVRAVLRDYGIIGSNIGSSAPIDISKVTVWKISLAQRQQGELMFNITWDTPSDWITNNAVIEWMAFSAEDEVGTLFEKNSRQNYGVSLKTGTLIWGPTESQHYLDSLDDTKSGARLIAYGKLYSASVGGIVYCYDVKNGTLLWKYEMTDPYNEILWGTTWWARPLFVTDGKLYVGHYEHSANDPMPRGAPFVCLNAETGEVIWRVDGLFRQTRWGGRAIIGDSIIATMDTYDLRIYAIGKGPSATTVTASPKSSVHGTSLLVEGVVTDISPGTQEYALRARFPHGVPAVADECMSEWMLYVYKQFPCPTNVKGVEVIIEVLDPNGNYYEVARATSDGSGFYSATFDPPVPGKYTIFARFAGSKSYWGSRAETAIVVEEAPQVTPAPTPAPQAPVETYFAVSTMVIIIAIAIVGVILLHKR